MNQVQPMGFWKCLVACTSICAAGCSGCLIDGPMFIADSATGGVSLASGASAGSS